MKKPVFLLPADISIIQALRLDGDRLEKSAFIARIERDYAAQEILERIFFIRFVCFTVIPGLSLLAAFVAAFVAALV